MEQLTLLSLLVLGSVWLTCRSEYLGGFRKGLLISQGTDSVRTNLAGLRRERGEKGMERRGREMETHQSFEGAFGVTLCLQTALESLSKANPRGTSSRSAPAPGCSQPSGSPLHPGYSQTPPRDVGGLKPPMVGCEQHPSPPAEGLQFREDQQPSQPPHKLGASASIRIGHHPLPRCRFLGRAGGQGAGSEHPALSREIFGGKASLQPRGP